MWKPKVERREMVLRDALINGPKWETPSHVLVAAVSQAPKRPKQKCVRKRVGCKQAKGLEQLDNVGATLEGDE